MKCDGIPKMGKARYKGVVKRYPPLFMKLKSAGCSWMG